MPVGARRGILCALPVTGGVITSAGLLLAATFSALAVLPLLILTQVAFIVAFGVLLATFVVRSLVVPAAVHLIGDRVWWPCRLARGRPAGPAGRPTPAELASSAPAQFNERGIPDRARASHQRSSATSRFQARSSQAYRLRNLHLTRRAATPPAALWPGLTARLGLITLRSTLGIQLRTAMRRGAATPGSRACDGRMEGR
jgi:MMPL family